MKPEKIFSIILTLFFMAFFAITKGFPALAGGLFCFSIFVFLVCFEQIRKPPEINKANDAAVTNLEHQNELKNKSIAEIEDRLGRVEMALGFKKANPGTDIK